MAEFQHVRRREHASHVRALAANSEVGIVRELASVVHEVRSNGCEGVLL